MNFKKFIPSADGEDDDYPINLCGNIDYAVAVEVQSGTDTLPISLGDAFDFTYGASTTIYSGVMSL